MTLLRTTILTTAIRMRMKMRMRMRVMIIRRVIVVWRMEKAVVLWRSRA